VLKHEAQRQDAGKRNQERVRAAYRCVLGREAEPEGLSHWTAFLNGGGSFDKLLQGFVRSAEFQHRLQQQAESPDARSSAETIAEEPQAAAAASRISPSGARGFRFAQEFDDGSGIAAGSALQRPDAARQNPLETYFDSLTAGPGIWKWRHYFEIYHRHFAKFIGREVHVMEIGVFSGGSLGLWKNYFGPQCRIYGLDIMEACRSYEDESVRILIGDQGDRNFWKQVKAQVPMLDVVIDDGSHWPEDQIVTLEEVLPHSVRKITREGMNHSIKSCGP